MTKNGYKQTEEHRKNSGNAHLGIKISEAGCRNIGNSKRGVLNPNYGKQMSAEQRKKISNALSGDKNPMFGKHPSKETRIKLSAIHKGKTLSKEHCKKISESKMGEKNPMFGKHISISAKEKISNALSGDKNVLYGKHLPKKTCEKISISRTGKTRGELHPNWKGGISFEPYCQLFDDDFKDRSRARYDYKCVECRKTQEENGRALSVHHVCYDKKTCCKKGEMMGDRKFVVLCISCHVKTNTDRGGWEDWFTEIINEFYDGICYLPKPSPHVENI
jgi:hypothetical protein